MRCPYCHCESPVSPATFAFPISIEPGDLAFSALNECIEVDQGYCLRCRGHVVVVRRFYDGEEIDAEIVYPALRGESGSPGSPIPEGYRRKLAEAENLVRENPEASAAISRWIVRRMRKRLAPSERQAQWAYGDAGGEPASDPACAPSLADGDAAGETTDAAALVRHARIALEEAFCGETTRSA